MEQREYRVTGMTCAHCERAVREEVASIAGVDGIEVDAAAGTLALGVTAPVEDDAVIAAVAEAGYEAARVS